MIFATVSWGDGDETYYVDLEEAGWQLRGVASSPINAILGRMASPLDYGPADGDPVARAAEAAADLLNGRVTYIRPTDPLPTGAVE